MLKGISMAAKAMKNQTARHDMIANNLANVNTTGFKKDIAVFQQMDTLQGEKDTLVRVAVSYEQGPVTRTDRPLDLAIQGEGFFVVDTDAGERYTRAGAFMVDSDGFLVTLDGDLLSGGISVPPGNIDITREGLVRVDGATMGEVRVVTFDEISRLEKAGSGLLKAPEDLSPTDLGAEDKIVLSGFLESSNVEVVTEMTEMITALKAYEISQKALKSEDEILKLLTGTVGRIG
ncbi:MAG: flagellar hook-basal body protein [Bacteroidales bacterium]|nr:flagellar hook-basal body protein [Candidatus Latescibacterota bacterium]